MNMMHLIGEIYDVFIEEAENANIAAERRKRRRNATLAAAGAMGIVIAAFMVGNIRAKNKKIIKVV